MTLDGRIAPAARPAGPRQPYWITCEAARAPSSPSAGRLTPRLPASIPCWPTIHAHRPQRSPPSPPALAASSSTQPSACPRLQNGCHGEQRPGHLYRLEGRGRISALRSRGIRVEVLPAEAGSPATGLRRRGGKPARSARQGLDKLGEEGILTVLTETGTRLNTALLAGGLVDRVHLFVSPQIMGSDASPPSKAWQPHPHGRSRSRALRQRPRPLLPAPRPLAG